LERRLRKGLKATNDSWRVDSDVRPGERQMGVLVPGRGFRGRNDRLLALGQTRCRRRRALSEPKPWEARTIRTLGSSTTDKDAAYPPAIVQLKAEGVLEENCQHLPVQHLNNVLEQTTGP
jgi:transposase, IS6 family